jgi:mRNA interferase RelE/StbE
LTSYRLVFLRDAKKEWDKLGNTIRAQFGKKLAERLENPHIPSARLHDMPDCYKIKLRAAGYRLVYRVDDGRVVVIVVAVGKRERNAVYKIAAGRV